MFQIKNNKSDSSSFITTAGVLLNFFFFFDAGLVNVQVFKVNYLYETFDWLFFETCVL